MKKLRNPNEIIITFYNNSIAARFKDTKISIFPNKLKDDVTLIEMNRLQEKEGKSLCFNKEVRVFKERTLTRSFLGLTPNGLYGLHMILKKLFGRIDADSSNDKVNKLITDWKNDGNRTVDSLTKQILVSLFGTENPNSI